MYVSKYRRARTDEEEALVQQISLSPLHQNSIGPHEATYLNQQPILPLLALLGMNGGIPEHWTRYWADPDYNPGHIKTSRKNMFKRNGCYGDNIYTHAHFIPYLRYLVFGNELPAAVSNAFEREVGNPQWVNSSDALLLSKHARRLVRENEMTETQVAEKFFKLSLDMGLDLDVALAVRRSVKQMH